MARKTKAEHLEAISSSKERIARAEYDLRLDVRIAYQERERHGIEVNEIAEAAGLTRQRIHQIVSAER